MDDRARLSKARQHLLRVPLDVVEVVAGQRRLAGDRAPAGDPLEPHGSWDVRLGEGRPEGDRDILL